MLLDPGVPQDATTAWIMRELERRHLVRPSRPNERLDYDILIAPGSGAPLRRLYAFQNLANAGMRNNCTLHVRPYLSGGAPGSAQGMCVVQPCVW